MAYDGETTRLVPGGISVHDVLVDDASARAQERLASRAVFMSEQADLADRIAAGTATPDEEARFASRLSFEVGQGYN
ncbi:MAG TPA: hypothetical protein VL362_02705 [Patescibacteria group bacterium]|jgi:hypothetical protein|nr:hypothetical protein [Patescibacteria group bacterium]